MRAGAHQVDLNSVYCFQKLRLFEESVVERDVGFAL
jgi:hypothetical protein